LSANEVGEGVSERLHVGHGSAPGIGSVFLRDTVRPIVWQAVFWLPEAGVVEVFHLNDDGKYVLEETAAEDGHLEFGLFPDLSIPLEDVWFVPPEEETQGD
jgi:hypothetical protein